MGGGVRAAGVLVAFATLLTFAVGVQGAPAAERQGERRTAPWLEVESWVDDSRVSRVEVRLHVPLTGDARDSIERLRSTPAGFSDRYRRALEEAFTLGGFLSRDQASAVVSGARELPELRLSNGWATLEATARFGVLWWQRPGAMELESIAVERDNRLHVSVRTPGGRPASAYPLPVEDDANGTLRWEFHGDAPPAVTFSLPEAEDSGDEYDPMLVAFELVVLGLPFLLLLMVAAIRPRSADMRLGRASIGLGAAGLALSIACAAFYVLQDNRFFDDGGDVVAILSEGDAYLEALVPGLGVAAFAALVAGGWFRAAAVAAVALGVAEAVRRTFGPNEGFLSWQPEHAYLVAGLVLAALLIAVAVAALARWAVAILPDRVHSWGSGLSRRLRFWSLLAVVGVMVAQILLATHGHHAPRSGFDADDSNWAAALTDFLQAFPIQLASLTRNAALALFGLALAAWLWRRVDEGEMDFASWRDSFAFALLVATLVPGLNGQIDGYPAPLGFVFALAAFSLAVHHLARSRRSGLARDAGVKREAPDLLRRAGQLAVVRRQRQALTDDLLANDIEQDEHDERVQRLDVRKGELLSGTALASIADPDDRARETLTHGLGGEEGARARLRSVLRNGWWVVAVPIVYSAYALFDLRAEGAVSAFQPMGLSYLTVSLIDQTLMWPILVWCFVIVAPIVPGRIGPLKGLLTGLFCALPPALARPLIDDPLGPSQWLFLAAELTLVLTIVGAVLDYRAVRRIGGDLRQLGELYSITNVRVGLAYLTPLLLLLFSVGQGLATGDGASALEELITNASSLVPGGR